MKNEDFEALTVFSTWHVFIFKLLILFSNYVMNILAWFRLTSVIELRDEGEL